MIVNYLLFSPILYESFFTEEFEESFETLYSREFANVREGRCEWSSDALRAIAKGVASGRVMRCEWSYKVDHHGGPPLLT